MTRNEAMYAQIRGEKEIGTPEQCQFKNCPYHKQEKPKYKALFCNCEGLLKRMSESEPNSDEIELLRQKWKRDENWLITGGATKYECPHCKAQFIGIEAQEINKYERHK